MTPIQLAGRLKTIAERKPTDIWRELHALAAAIQYDTELGDALAERDARKASDLEALVRATQEPVADTRRRRWWR